MAPYFELYLYTAYAALLYMQVWKSDRRSKIAEFASIRKNNDF